MLIGCGLFLIIFIYNQVFNFILMENLILLFLTLFIFPLHLYMSLNAFLFDYVYNYSIKIINYFLIVFLTFKISILTFYFFI